MPPFKSQLQSGNQKIRLVVSSLVSLLALACFILSYDALKKLAVEQEAVPEALGWVFPIVVDGAIIVFSLAVLEFSLRRKSANILRLLVLLVTLGSVFFNISHVHSDKLLSKILAGTPPVLLFASFEVLMLLIKDQVELNQSEQSQREAEAAEKVLDKAERQKIVAQLHEEGLTAQEMMQQIPNVSLRTIQRDIGELG